MLVWTIQAYLAANFNKQNNKQKKPYFVQSNTFDDELGFGFPGAKVGTRIVSLPDKSANLGELLPLSINLSHKLRIN